MSAIQQLLADHINIWTAADAAKRTGRGRASGNAGSVYGVKKLRELILELAVRGKLVPQDANDEPASELLKRIQVEKEKLVKAGKIKKDKPLPEITEEEKSFELPVGWEWARLGEITNFGSTVKLDAITKNCWVLDLEDIEKDTSKLLQKLRFSERESLSDKNLFKKGDVLYCKLRPYLNKVIVADEDGVCTTEILPIRCYGPFESHYFKTALKSPYFLNYVNERSYGMKMPRLGTEDGRMACFPLAPFTEQHRIVAKVDELMALCDQLEAQHNNAAEAHEKIVSVLLQSLTNPPLEKGGRGDCNWQRIAAHFETLFTTEASIDALKQTLLQLAVMGKLVPQDANDEPASALLKKIRAEKDKLIKEGKIKKDKPLPAITEEEKPFGLPSGWEWVRLSQLTTHLGDGLHGTPQYTSNEQYYFVNGNNLKDGKIVLKSETKTVDKKEYEKHKKPLGSNCVLVSINGTLGSVAFYNGEQIILGKSACYFNLTSGISKVFIRCLIEAPGFLSYSKKSATGSTIKNLGLKAMNDLPIALPPLPEQHRIVAKVDELMALCDQLKTRITEANRLQQTIADVVVAQAVA